jgi:hypothetical protein
MCIVKSLGTTEINLEKFDRDTLETLKVKRK